MRIADIKRLKGDADDTTHLARYDRALHLGRVRVLHCTCPDCEAPIGQPCHPVKS